MSKQNIQSFVANMTAPFDLDELYYTTIECGSCLLPDLILYMDYDYTEWTSPRWAKIGDVVFFMLAGSSRTRLTAIRTEFNKRQYEYDEYERNWLRFWINHGLALHKFYGGKIFALGRITGSPFVQKADPDDKQHWKSNIYAAINEIHILDNPISIDEFRDFITISRQSSITGVFGKEYDQLMDLIASKNKIPKSYRGLTASSEPLSKVTEETWFNVLKEHRSSFFLEQQFRTYAVDYFLKEFGDRKTFYKEACCHKAGKASTFVDNLVFYKGKWLPVEVKLNISIEQDLETQLEQYIGVDYITVDNGAKRLDPDRLWSDRILVVDTENIYLYIDHMLHELIAWSDIKTKKKLLSALEEKMSISNS